MASISQGVGPTEVLQCPLHLPRKISGWAVGCELGASCIFISFSVGGMSIKGGGITHQSLIATSCQFIPNQGVAATTLRMLNISPLHPKKTGGTGTLSLEYLTL